METARKLESTRRAQVIQNAYLESFTIHARVLADFLYPLKEARKDDVVPEDYGIDWPRCRPSKARVLVNISEPDRVGREIAHLTYFRHIDPAAKEWPVQEIARALDEVLLKFVGLLDSSKCCNELRQFAQRNRKVITHKTTGVTNATLPMQPGSLVVWDTSVSG
jgi:hypothetical protein